MSLTDQEPQELCNDAHDDAAEEIRELRAKLAAAEARAERYRAALKPFSDFAKHYPTTRRYGGRPSTGTVFEVSSTGLPDASLTVEDLHRAAALAEGEAGCVRSTT